MDNIAPNLCIKQVSHSKVNYPPFSLQLRNRSSLCPIMTDHRAIIIITPSALISHQQCSLSHCPVQHPQNSSRWFFRPTCSPSSGWPVRIFWNFHRWSFYCSSSDLQRRLYGCKGCKATHRQWGSWTIWINWSMGECVHQIYGAVSPCSAFLGEYPPFCSDTTDTLLYQVAWYLGDTTESLGLLAAGSVDIAVTYNEAAEKQSKDSGAAEDLVYGFRVSLKEVYELLSITLIKPGPLPSRGAELQSSQPRRQRRYFSDVQQNCLTRKYRYCGKCENIRTTNVNQ